MMFGSGERKPHDKQLVLYMALCLPYCGGVPRRPLSNSPAPHLPIHRQGYEAPWVGRSQLGLLGWDEKHLMFLFFNWQLPLVTK